MMKSGFIIIIHFQEHSLSFSLRFCKPDGLANQNLYFFQMPLDIEKENLENETKNGLKNGWCMWI